MPPPRSAGSASFSPDPRKARQWVAALPRANALATEIQEVSAENYYGKYYQDIHDRVPAIEAARRDLGWEPTTDLDTAIRRTIAYYVKPDEPNGHTANSI